MPFIYLEDENVRLKSYSATTKGATSIVRVDIEVADPMRLGFLLKELETIDRAQKAQKVAEKTASTKSKPSPLLALPAPLLRLAHRAEGE